MKDHYEKWHHRNVEFRFVFSVLRNESVYVRTCEKVDSAVSVIIRWRQWTWFEKLSVSDSVPNISV